MENENLATKEEMIEEAVRRMKVLKLHQNPIKEFEEEQKLNRSDKGILFWLDEDEEKMVRDWENQYGYVVYHVIHSFSNLGETYELLYVAPYMEDWEYDNENLLEGYTIAHVINKSMPDCSESGTIGVKNFAGGLIRTA